MSRSRATRPSLSRPSHEPSGTVRGRRWIVVGLALLFLIILLRTAWMSDDAVITLRVVDNLIGGHGPNWNVGERVQVYTHPLWFLLLSLASLVTNEFYLTTLVLSMALSVTALVVLLAGAGRSLPGMLTAGAMILLSPAMVDYSTSGLENPLSYLLVGLFAVTSLRHPPGAERTFRLAALAALLCVNRLDLVVLVAPAVAYDVVSHRHVRSLAVASLPLVGWLVFAVIYYGSPLPNTAYAKLSAGVERAWYLEQGFFYLVDAAIHEPLLSLTLLAGLVVGLRAGAMRRFLALGIVAALAYTVWIGGDFMRGRMLTVPAFLAAALVADADVALPRRWMRAAVPAALVILSLFAPNPTLLSGASFGARADLRERAQEARGIADERAFYFPKFGLLNGKPLHIKPGHDMQTLRTRQSLEKVDLKLIHTAGFGGLLCGPRPYVIDEFSLANPLLSRLPIIETSTPRIGHLRRNIPAGYILTLLDGTNQIRDAALRQYYDRIAEITRGPLFRARRWRTIVGMAAGRYDHLIPAVVVPLDDAECSVAASRHLDALGPRLLWRAARVHCLAGDFERVEPILRRLGQLEIAYSDEYIRQAINLAMSLWPRDPQFAERLIRLILEIEPDNADVEYGLGAVLFQSGRKDEGLDLLRRAARGGSEEARRALEKH